MGAKIHRNSLKPGHKILWYEIKEILGQGGSKKINKKDWN